MMKTQPALAGGVLHVVVHLTERTCRALNAEAAALQALGVPQTVVLAERAGQAHRMLRLLDAVHVIAVAPARPGWRQWHQLREAVRQALQEHRPDALHLHGWAARACTLGLADGITVQASPRDAPLAHLQAAGSPAAVEEALARQAGPRPPVLDPQALAAPRREARRPLIVSGSQHDNRKAVELFCRAAVVFGAEELGLSFNWFGALSEASAARLKAAGIGAVQPDDAAWLPRLQSAWVFYAGGGEAGFPLQLLQAMACGLPCLAPDEPVYRRAIEDGTTGLLYRSQEEAQQLLGMLIDDAALRLQLGEAARQALLLRYSPSGVWPGWQAALPAANGLLAVRRTADG